MTAPVVEVANLTKEFTVKSSHGLRVIRRTVHAVSDVSLTVPSGKTVGLVGESGSGKTTVGRCILRLIEPTAGSVKFQGTELVGLPAKDLRKLRRSMQIVFQDPYASLDPKMTIGASIAEPLQIQKVEGNHQDRVAELLELVGLAPDHARRFPHEFSGGQRQRVGVARALALNPSFIVLDEPVSALDVSIQAEIMKLLVELRERLGLSYLFIAHDLAVVRQIADRVAVMYLGRIVETGPADVLYSNPQHPYTQALLSAVPIPDPTIELGRQRIVLQGDLPSPIDPPSGCRFRTRCWRADERCATEQPTLTAVQGAHEVACHYPGAETAVSVSGGAR